MASYEYEEFEGGLFWDVECILDQNDDQFLVKWLDWNADSWEPRENVENWEGFYAWECYWAEKNGNPKPKPGVRTNCGKAKRKNQGTKYLVIHYFSLNLRIQI